MRYRIRTMWLQWGLRSARPKAAPRLPRGRSNIGGAPPCKFSSSTGTGLYERLTEL